MTANQMDGKVAVVTGGGGGIGRAVASTIAAAGGSVVINDVGAAVDGSGADTTVAETVAKEIESTGGSALANTESVATFDGAEALVGATLDAFGRLDLLVNCAGNTSQMLPWELDEENWDRTIAIHLKGHFACMRAASAPMREQRSGAMVAITSHVGLYGLPDAPAYSAAKTGITGLTKSFSLALEPYGVTANVVAPSAVSRMSDTVPVEELRNRAEAMGVELPPEITEDQLRLMLIGDPAAVANFITYLGTDAASTITGQVFGVIGGHVGVFNGWSEAATMDKMGTWELDELPGAFDEFVRPHLAPAYPG